MLSLTLSLWGALFSTKTVLEHYNITYKSETSKEMNGPLNPVHTCSLAIKLSDDRAFD